MFEHIQVKRDIAAEALNRPKLKNKRGSRYTNLMSSRQDSVRNKIESTTNLHQNAKINKVDSKFSSSRPTPIQAS